MMTKDKGAGNPVPIKDKRRGGSDAPAERASNAVQELHATGQPAPHGGAGSRAKDAPPAEERSAAPAGQSPPAASAKSPHGKPQAPDYLNDLRRLQAEFDNYRKRMLKEQTAMAQRAAVRLIERLLPVLDNFEAAMAHGQGGTGIELVYKELRGVLEAEGLKEIPAEGTPFDPAVHDAVETRDSTDAAEMLVAQVYRRGYTLNGRVLRPAMVAVVRPAEPSDDSGPGDTEVQEAH